MKRINEAFAQLFKGKNPKSERAYLIQRICDTLFTQDDFKKILGQTSQMTILEIQEIFDKAKSWNVNPGALFWKLVKEKREMINKQINKD